ncbi:MAG: GlsB/YeaQ/YmgE family stress response membrane protein [Usitatibacter sp.]
MRLRMYVTLPDVGSARKLANDLLLARVEDRHMHFLARRGTDLGELHEASYLHKTDTVHGAFVGLVIGGLMGVLVGAILVNYPPQGVSMQLVAVLIAAIVGAALGTWVASMVGLQVPNSRLKGFDKDLEEGRVLLMLDVPSGRYDELRTIIARTHPEAADRGNEPTVPAFP